MICDHFEDGPTYFTQQYILVVFDDLPHCMSTQKANAANSGNLKTRYTSAG